MCNLMEIDNPYTNPGDRVWVYGQDANKGYVRAGIADASVTTNVEFKQWLDQHEPIRILYALNEPIVTPLPVQMKTHWPTAHPARSA